MEDYLDLFDLAAHQIQSVLQGDAAKGYSNKMNNIIIGTETFCFGVHVDVTGFAIITFVVISVKIRGH